MQNKYNDPRITDSKKKGVCLETGKEINKFDRILLDPNGMKTYCKDSKKFKEFAQANAPKLDGN